MVSPESSKMFKVKEDLDIINIITSAQKGDEEAWNNLMTRYSKLVWSATNNYGFSDGDREDIVQEVFVKLIKSIKSYDPSKGRFSTFITTITKRVCIDKLRKMKKQPPDKPFEPEKLVMIPSPEKDDVDNEDIQNKVKILGQIMNKELTAEQKLVITLFYYEKCSYPQIAGIMNRNYNWVKNTLFRTNAYLRKRLTEETVDKKSPKILRSIKRNYE